MTIRKKTKKDRFIYALLILLVIAAGILSRKTTLVPLIVGDILYAVMMFLMIKFLLIKSNWQKIGLISLSICYCIELAQLYDAPWINHIRSTTLGALVLGQGFLWSDMIAYTLGISICALIFYRFNPSIQDKG